MHGTLNIKFTILMGIFCKYMPDCCSSAISLKENHATSKNTQV